MEHKEPFSEENSHHEESNTPKLEVIRSSPDKSGIDVLLDFADWGEMREIKYLQHRPKIFEWLEASDGS